MIFTIPRSNCLRFVDKSQVSAPFNHDNRLLQDQGRVYDNSHVFVQKFSIGDDILIQIVSDYPTISIELYDCYNSLVDTFTPSCIFDMTSTIKVYQSTISTSLLGGIYYFKITATATGWNTQEFQSDYISVDNYSDYPLIQWRDSDYDGLYYGTANIIFGFRIEADIMKPIYVSENESFESFNSVIVNVQSKVKRQIDFQTDELPAYIWEKLALALSHKTLKINGISYVAVGGIEAEEIDALRFKVKATLQQSEYETYETFEETGGGVPPTQDGTIYSPDGVKAYSPDGVKIYKPW